MRGHMFLPRLGLMKPGHRFVPNSVWHTSHIPQITCRSGGCKVKNLRSDDMVTNSKVHSNCRPFRTCVPNCNYGLLNENDSLAYMHFAILGELSSGLSFTVGFFKGLRLLSLLVGFFPGGGGGGGYFDRFHTGTCRLGAQTQPCLKFFGTQKYYPV